ncbi:MAG: aspartate carbamoyltransferase catalytic subunit [Candidatus Obscuribacter sp.]|nr:aspartate carbamoyltransferase catalytic subunit [Candidatus Melainabacteria bacterium]MDX1988162.1 aspartate carbamoyltransferase catalytic subunit [Candidatus Obscuribacter sp.]
MIKTLNNPVSKDFVASVARANSEFSLWQKRRHLLNTNDLSLPELSLELALTHYYKEHRLHCLPPLTTLSDCTVATLFYENSTRTRSSFDLAARKMGATVLHLDVKSSSVAKGESLLDTAMNLCAMGVNAIVMRHSQSGAPDELAEQANQVLARSKDPARVKNLAVINAGDGAKSHPSQGLLDLYTMLSELDLLPSLDLSGKLQNPLQPDCLKGKKIAIIGDILHSRVARSNFWLLKNLGAEVHFAGPPSLLPQDFAISHPGAILHHSLKPAVSDADFIITLRIQLERQEQGLIASLDDYKESFQVNHERIKWAAKAVKVLHPGPINRGIEITESLADDEEYSRILSQVTNGVLTRMAVLTLLLFQHD